MIFLSDRKTIVSFVCDPSKEAEMMFVEEYPGGVYVSRILIRLFSLTSIMYCCCSYHQTYCNTVPISTVCMPTFKGVSENACIPDKFLSKLIKWRNRGHGYPFNCKKIRFPVIPGPHTAFTDMPFFTFSTPHVSC